MNHPMETGLRKDSKGEKIPEHFINEVTVEHNGNNILTADWGIAISKNPYLAFTFKGGKPGDMIKVSWKDNKGESATEEEKIG
jgi:sulfur-oxidizing protein SoxZ